jgi:hypothetical protein
MWEGVFGSLSTITEVRMGRHHHHTYFSCQTDNIKSLEEESAGKGSRSATAWKFSSWACFLLSPCPQTAAAMWGAGLRLLTPHLPSWDGLRFLQTASEGLQAKISPWAAFARIFYHHNRKEMKAAPSVWSSLYSRQTYTRASSNRGLWYLSRTVDNLYPQKTFADASESCVNNDPDSEVQQMPFIWWINKFCSIYMMDNYSILTRNGNIRS